MMLSKDGKLFRKLSVIDILVVLVIIAAVAGVGYKFSKSNVSSPIFAKEENVQIQFYHEEVPEYVAKAVKIGDPVREALQNVSFGTVSDIKISKSISWVESDSGEYVASSKEGYSSVLLTMDAKGIVNGGGITINNCTYYVGQTVNLYAGNAGFYSDKVAGKISAIIRK